MTNTLKYIMSIAGHDPSGGAGLLADIKVFEQHNLIGFGVATSVTFQNEAEFSGVNWLDYQIIISQIRPLGIYPVDVVKIGLIENLNVLSEILDKLDAFYAGVKVVWDPILRASAGYDFHNNLDRELLKSILERVYLITPNLDEAKQLGTGNQDENLAELSQHCRVYLKGGHGDQNANDQLWYQGNMIAEYQQEKIVGLEKHGSGCVLSSAIASQLALGQDVIEACKHAKRYTLEFLNSNGTLLGQHKNPTIEIHD